MANPLIWLMLLLGVALGALLYWGWLRLKGEEKHRLPAQWLLNARGMVTAEEQQVWKWLRQSFSDHVVMVKVPVMRFTVPSTRNEPKNKKQNWHELLGGVYCTFTVTNFDGKVVGCVDVPGKRGLSRAQREMKENLLQECGIGYTTVRANSLPSASAMRTAFLGEPPVMEADAEETRGGDSSFHAALEEFTSEKARAAKAAAIQELRDRSAAESDAADKNRDVGFNPDGTGSFQVRKKSSRFPVEFEDSFTLSNESRPAKLS
jgi:hypothetical protein